MGASWFPSQNQEEVLRVEGVTDFEPYAITPGGELMQDFFL